MEEKVYCWTVFGLLSDNFFLLCLHTFLLKSFIGKEGTWVEIGRKKVFTVVACKF